MGFGRVDPGVNLYCQKILIDQHSENVLPDWLRFLKGVVDSEDLPLNISRQALQDNALVDKLRRVITKRFLKFLDEQAKADPENYLVFWKTFGIYLKEGPYLRLSSFRRSWAGCFASSLHARKTGKPTSLADYVARMKEGQEDIYYINGPSRAAIEAGPYVEMFTANGISRSSIPWSPLMISSSVIWANLTAKSWSPPIGPISIPGAPGRLRGGRKRLLSPRRSSWSRGPSRC